jgi:anti-sigma factor, putative, ChrR family
LPDGRNIGEEFYSAYAAGALDPALTLLIETQAAIREDVRRLLHVSDSIAGAFLERETPAVMSDNALQKALLELDLLQENGAKPIAAAEIAGSILDELILLPEPLQEKALIAAGNSGWKFGGPGLKLMQIDVASEAKVELLRIEPGHGAPRHTHEGTEYTLVVSGGFTDENGSYGPGEVSIVDSSHTHQPIADPGEICYALAVTDGNLKFTGWLGALQKLFG